MNKHYLFSLIVLFFVGCNYSAPKVADQSTAGNTTIEKLPIGTIPGYQTIATGIISPKCLGCHSSAGGNSAGINLETYSNVKLHLASISSAVTSDSMPIRISPLTSKEKEVFLAWIDAGGPLNSMTVATGPTTPVNVPTPTPSTLPIPVPIPTPSPVPAPDKIDYKFVNTQVIGPRCLSCHSDSGGNSAGINLETYESVFNERNGIKSVVTSGSMPLPRSHPLTASQKQTILTWLSKGAPETVP